MICDTVDCMDHCPCALTLPLRVQVLNNHILTQNLYYNYYYQDPKYKIIGYLDPLGTHEARTTKDELKQAQLPSI